MPERLVGALTMVAVTCTREFGVKQGVAWQVTEIAGVSCTP